MKFKKIVPILFIGLLMMIGCKTKKVISTSGNTTEVLVQMKKGINPDDLSGKSPFVLVDKLPKDRTINKWKLTFDLVTYSKQDLVNYLINLDKVIAVDDKSKAVTPPIKGPKSPTQTKKM